MADPLDNLRAMLSIRSYSVTKTRQSVFQALQDKEPQSMPEIVAALSGQVDRASVYRTIKLFEKLGVVQRLQIGWKYKLELSDRFHNHHHHLTCVKCGQTVTLPLDDRLEQRLRILSHEKKFRMQGHQLEIQGLCQNCQPYGPNWSKT